MKISRTRKKSIALIVTLAFLLTLFPMALPAFAASYSRIGSLMIVDDDTTADLNDVKGEFSAGELKNGSSVIIRLPEGFEFRDNSGNVMDDTDWSTGEGNSIILHEEGNPSNTVATQVYVLDDNEIKLVVTETKSVDLNLFVNLDKVYVDEGFDGDITLTFDAPPGSGFDDGSVVVGRVSGGEVEVEVIDSDTFSDSGWVTFRISEDRAGALEENAESVKIVLPDGFVWDSGINGKWIGDDVDGDGKADIKLIYGDTSIDNNNNKIEIQDDNELVVNLSDLNAGDNADGTEAATCIEIAAKIVVDDETEAELGDIVADVEGESDVTPDEIVVGTYGEYDVKVTAGDPETVYAGKLEQAIADITIEELIEGSLVNNRTITLELPDWAKWGKIDSDVSDSGVSLVVDSFPGKDGRVLKYRIDSANAKDAAELDLEDMEVVLSPEAPAGDLVVKIGGTAGIDEEVKVAEVKAPVDVAVSDTPSIVIGKADQKIGDITITEADAGMLEAGKDLVLELPKDVEWDDYNVEVASGDLDLGDIDVDDNVMTIEIDDDSNDASTIKITGTVVAYRTVPEGEVTLDIKGDALIEVNDIDHVNNDYVGEVAEYYGDPVSGYYVISGEPAIEYDEDGLFEDDDTVASVVVAKVGTPAEEGIGTSVFTIGSTTYTLDGVEQTMDVAPYVKDGRTYLPVRYVGKALGVSDQNIMWSNKTATFIKGDRVVQVTVGSKTMLVNGSKIEMDVAPEIKNGRTMLPIRWVGVAFGATLNWDNEAKTVTIEP